MEILILRTILGSIRALLTNTLDEEEYRQFIKKIFLNNNLIQIFQEETLRIHYLKLLKRKIKLQHQYWLIERHQDYI